MTHIDFSSQCTAIYCLVGFIFSLFMYLKVTKEFKKNGLYKNDNMFVPYENGPVNVLKLHGTVNQIIFAKTQFSRLITIMTTERKNE